MNPTLASLLRAPDLGHATFAVLWLIGATLAFVRKRQTIRKCFAYVATGWSGMYLGGMGGGMLTTSREDWGKSLIALLVGALLGAATGFLIGRRAAGRTAPYFVAQAVFTTIVVFLLPLF